MRKQILLITTFLLVTALALTGCGGLSAGDVNEQVQFVETATPEGGATAEEALTPTAGATMEETGTPAAGATITETLTPRAGATGTAGTPSQATPGATVQAIPPVVSQAQNEWPMANKDYTNSRADLQAGISSANVENLGVAWTFAIPGLGAYGAAASNPIIANGVVYFQDLASNVFALNLDTGEVIWQQMFDEPVVGPNGPAIGYGKVFAHGGVDTIRALDEQSGELLWEQKLSGPTGSQQPYVYGGMLYTGTAAGAVEEKPGGPAIRGYAPGASGFVYALDQESGQISWQFQVVEEGFWGHEDVNSGGGVWFPPAINTDDGMTYWGTGNPAPFPGTTDWPNGSSRPGPNLYTDSILALDHQSGKLVWFNQVNPHDLFDHDFQAPQILATANINGEQRPIIVGAGKLGRVIAFDRETGDIIWNTPVGDHQNDDLDSLPLDETIEVLPGVYGGVETPMAFADGVVYVPVNNLPSPYTATGFDAADGTEAVQNIERRTNLEEATSLIVAIDVATGEILWTTDLNAANFGAATVVNDLVFTSTYDGMIYALNRENGSIVWTLESPAGINAWPAVAGDTIIFPAGVSSSPILIALRVGATGTLPAPSAAATGTVTPKVTGTRTPTVRPGTGTPAAAGTPTSGQGMGVVPSGTTTPPPTAMTSATVPAGANEVEVTEVDGKITMPNQLPAGMTAFRVTNNGTLEHNFEIAGDGINNFFDTNLKPGDTRTMVVDLKPGTYRVWCPVNGHAQLGMDMQLTVVAAGTTTPSSQ